MRCLSSSDALRANVQQRMDWAGTPCFMRFSYLATRVVVLPVPGPARMRACLDETSAALLFDINFHGEIPYCRTA